MTHCTICGRGQRTGENYLANSRHAICLDCADAVSVEGLALLADARTSREMLLALGFWWNAD